MAKFDGVLNPGWKTFEKPAQPIHIFVQLGRQLIENRAEMFAELSRPSEQAIERVCRIDQFFHVREEAACLDGEKKSGRNARKSWDLIRRTCPFRLPGGVGPVNTRAIRSSAAMARTRRPRSWRVRPVECTRAAKSRRAPILNKIPVPPCIPTDRMNQSIRLQ